MTRYGLTLWGETLAESIEVAQLADASGIDSVWTSESQRSPFVPLSGAAQVTSRVGLGVGIALAFVRSALTTTITALDLDEISNGRLTLGLGSGVSRLNEAWHGATFGKPVPHLREVVAAIRAIEQMIATGEVARLSGEYLNLDLAGYSRPYRPVRGSIPLYLAGVGQLMLRLAGEVADGWLGHELNSERYIEGPVMSGLERGLRQSGRQREAFTVAPSLVCAISDSPAEAQEMASGTVAFYASVRSFAPLFEWHGFGAEAEGIRRAFRGGDHEGWRAQVSKSMVQTFAAAGTRSQVQERLRSYAQWADLVKVSAPPHAVTPEVTRAQMREVMAAISEIG